MPKLDIAANLHQPTGRDETVDDDAEQSDSSDAQDTQAAETDDTAAGGDVRE
jgi:hypothetical protein